MAVDLRAGAFLAAVLRAGAFLAVVLRAGAFLAAVLRAGAFLAVVLRAGAFLAAVLRAGAFLGRVFFEPEPSWRSRLLHRLLGRGLLGRGLLGRGLLGCRLPGRCLADRLLGCCLLYCHGHSLLRGQRRFERRTGGEPDSSRRWDRYHCSCPRIPTHAWGPDGRGECPETDHRHLPPGSDLGDDRVEQDPPPCLRRCAESSASTRSLLGRVEICSRSSPQRYVTNYKPNGFCAQVKHLSDTSGAIGRRTAPRRHRRRRAPDTVHVHRAGCRRVADQKPVQLATVFWRTLARTPSSRIQCNRLASIARKHDDDEVEVRE